MKHFFIQLTIGICFLSIKAQTWTYPETKECDSVQSYHGEEVPDPYQWLEDEQAKETKEWVLYQQKNTESFFRQLRNAEKIRINLENFVKYDKLSSPQLRGKNLYYFKQNVQNNQPVLIEKNTINKQERVLLDPNKIDVNGNISIGDIEFSNDNKYLAYTASLSGSDWRTIYVIDLSTGMRTSDSLKFIKFSSLSWDKNGFYYNGFGDPNNLSKPIDENNMESRIFYHQLNTVQTQDKLIYSDASNPRYLKNMTLSADGNCMVVAQSKGIGKNKLMFKLKGGKQWINILKSYEFNHQVIDCDQNKIWVLTNEQAPNNKLVAINVSKPEDVKTIIPESNLKLAWVNKIGNHLFACYIKDAAEIIEQYNLQGQKINTISLPGKGTVQGFDGKPGDTVCFYTYSSFLTPPSIYKYNMNSKTSELYHATKTDYDLNGYEMKQEFYKDKNGVPIPIFLVHKKGMAMERKNPLFLYGYGGFNISMIPNFNPFILPFIESGGIYAVVCLKGGGEYGNAWHEAGILKNKPAVFDDFIAAAEYLINRGYTNSKKLAIHGRSNGGLLVGACINKRPDLFKVAVGTVGVYDMLRYQKYTVGWTWATEYGVSDSLSMFETLYGYSPYHQVKEQAYPATLLLTADHDDRVVPMHTYKFGAKLQRFNKSDYPILIRVDREAGHGAGKPLSKSLKEWNDIWSFVYYYLNM